MTGYNIDLEAQELSRKKEYFIYWDGLPVKDNYQADHSATPRRFLRIKATAEKIYSRHHLLHLISAWLQMKHPDYHIHKSGMHLVESPKNDELIKKTEIITAKRMITQTGNKLKRYEQGEIRQCQTEIFGVEQLKKYLSDPNYIALQSKHIRYIDKLNQLTNHE